MMYPLIRTSDGSLTLDSETYRVTYHSVHGAVSESLHIYIEAGLKKKQLEKKNLRILEIGLGTGLNAYLTYLNRRESFIHYIALEPAPIDSLLIPQLGFPQFVEGKETSPIFEKIHACEWEKEIEFASYFIFQKHLQSLQDFNTNQKFDIIYFDAFDPEVQPELWTEDIFSTLFSMTAPEGIVVTYCAKGSVRRAMQHTGYITERLEGPKGKREILRATR